MFHQLNGENSMVEGVMTDVNSLVQHPKQKNQMNYVQQVAAAPQPDELQNAHSPIAPLPQVPVMAARCVNGTLLRPSNAEDDQPSTA